MFISFLFYLVSHYFTSKGKWPLHWTTLIPIMNGWVMMWGINNVPPGEFRTLRRWRVVKIQATIGQILGTSPSNTTTPKSVKREKVSLLKLTKTLIWKKKILLKYSLHLWLTILFTDDEIMEVGLSKSNEFKKGKFLNQKNLIEKKFRLIFF